MADRVYIPEANHTLPVHPGRVQEIVDREKSRPSRYVYKHVVVMHDRYDVEGLPTDPYAFIGLINDKIEEFQKAGMGLPIIEVEVNIEPGSYGDGDSARGALHFAAMRDATKDEADSFDAWKIEQERSRRASEKATLERRLRELG